MANFSPDDHGHRAGLPLDPEFGKQTENTEDIIAIRRLGLIVILVSGFVILSLVFGW